MRTQVAPMASNYIQIINKTIYFDIETPCKRMIHVRLRKIFLLLQNASNSNVQSIPSTSKKCHR